MKKNFFIFYFYFILSFLFSETLILDDVTIDNDSKVTIKFHNSPDDITNNIKLILDNKILNDFFISNISEKNFYGIILDNSGSILLEDLEMIKSKSSYIINNLKKDDKVIVWKVNDRRVLLSPVSSPDKNIINKISQLKREGNYSRLFDSIIDSINELNELKKDLNYKNYQFYLLFFSDGEDILSKNTDKNLINLKTDIPFFFFSYDSKNVEKQAEPYKILAKNSFGKYYKYPENNDIDKLFFQKENRYILKFSVNKSEILKKDKYFVEISRKNNDKDKILFDLRKLFFTSFDKQEFNNNIIVTKEENFKENNLNKQNYNQKNNEDNNQDHIKQLNNNQNNNQNDIEQGINNNQANNQDSKKQSDNSQKDNQVDSKNQNNNIIDKNKDDIKENVINKIIKNLFNKDKKGEKKEFIEKQEIQNRNPDNNKKYIKNQINYLYLLILFLLIVLLILLIKKLKIFKFSFNKKEHSDSKSGGAKYQKNNNIINNLDFLSGDSAYISKNDNKNDNNKKQDNKEHINNEQHIKNQVTINDNKINENVTIDENSENIDSKIENLDNLDNKENKKIEQSIQQQSIQDELIEKELNENYKLNQKVYIKAYKDNLLKEKYSKFELYLNKKADFIDEPEHSGEEIIINSNLKIINITKDFIECNGSNIYLLDDIVNIYNINLRVNKIEYNQNNLYIYLLYPVEKVDDLRNYIKIPPTSIEVNKKTILFGNPNAIIEKMLTKSSIKWDTNLTEWLEVEIINKNKKNIEIISCFPIFIDILLLMKNNIDEEKKIDYFLVTKVSDMGNNKYLISLEYIKKL